MKHSKLYQAQQVVAALTAFGYRHVVVSPGSRNAPLIIELAAYPEIIKYSIVDERSAAFFALGLAQQLQEPVAVVCTSGSALLNYYPAVTEAFYSQIPLTVVSADRPKHLIDIGDGQTIRQEHVYANHILAEANLSETDLKFNEQSLLKALQMQKEHAGPIHINVPFSEPLYEKAVAQKDIFRLPQIKKESLLDEKPIPLSELEKYAEIWNQANRKMLIIGVHQPDEMLQTQLEHLTKDPSVVILIEATSNVKHPEFIACIDKMVFPMQESHFEDFRPDVLLTLGGMVVSKKIKYLLRKYPPKHHWHIDKNRALDTYHVLEKHFEVSTSLFFSQFFFLTQTKESDFKQQWITLKQKRQQKHKAYFKEVAFSDFSVYEFINRNMPKDMIIHFSNSAVIRYAQLFIWLKNQDIYANRGTSGIDGSVSTAVGAAVASENQVVLVTGDLSFFYDSNALWNRYVPKNFKIILVNNGGGGIFRFIPGPADSGSMKFFEYPHELKAVDLCKMHGVNYLSASSQAELTAVWDIFIKHNEQTQVLEIKTPSLDNAAILKTYFSFLS